MNKNLKISPIIQGGAQERGLRGGTENLIGIAGLAKAFELANHDIEGHQRDVQALKTYMMEELKKRIPGVGFHGETDCLTWPEGPFFHRQPTRTKAIAIRKCIRVQE